MKLNPERIDASCAISREQNPRTHIQTQCLSEAAKKFIRRAKEFPLCSAKTALSLEQQVRPRTGKRQPGSAAKPLASEPRLQHTDHCVLLGNDLSLPDQRDRHQTHGKDADRQHQSSLGFRSWNVRDPPQPVHVRGSCRLRRNINQRVADVSLRGNIPLEWQSVCHRLRVVPVPSLPRFCWLFSISNLQQRAFRPLPVQSSA